MRDITIDDFVRFKNLEFKMEQMKNMRYKKSTIDNAIDEVMKDVNKISNEYSFDKTDIDEIIKLPFDEAMEMFIQEFLKNNKKGEK